MFFTFLHINILLLYSPTTDFIFYFFLALCSLPSHFCREVAMPSLSPYFSNSTHFFLSISLALEAPLSACGLFTKNIESPSEVWLACTSRERIMNEFTPTLQPSTSFLYSQILSSSFLLLSYLKSHFSTCVCLTKSVVV